jgi:hypothetical protein
MSLAVCKDGFRAICRLVIRVDSCFLKGHYKGQLLVVVEKDPNDNICFIAISVMKLKIRIVGHGF